MGNSNSNVVISKINTAFNSIKQQAFATGHANLIKNYDVERLIDMSSFIQGRENAFVNMNTGQTSADEWERFYENPQAGAYNRIVALDYIRQLRYLDYDQMELTVPEVSSALDFFADFIVQKNLTTNTFLEMVKQFTYFDVDIDTMRQIQMEVNILAEQWGINNSDTLWECSRNTIKYGDMFVMSNLTLDGKKVPKGINNLELVTPYAVDIISEINKPTSIIGYTYNPGSVQYVNMRFLTTGGSFAGDNSSAAQYFSNSTNKQNGRKLTPLEMHHFYMSRSIFTPYGTSLLEGSRKIWKQLLMLEDALAYWRLVNGVQRKVFKIDIGTMPESKGLEYVRKIRNLFRKQPFVDPEINTTSPTNWTSNILAQDENIWIPVRPNSGTSIDTLPEVENKGMVETLDYFMGKIYSKLKVPKAYLTEEGDINAKATLIGENSVFAKIISRNQSTAAEQWWQVFKTHYYLTGNIARIVGVKLRFSSMDSVLEKEMLESLSSRIDIAQTLVSLAFEIHGESVHAYSPEYIMRMILKMPEEEIAKTLKEIERLEQRILIKNRNEINDTKDKNDVETEEFSYDEQSDNVEEENSTLASALENVEEESNETPMESAESSTESNEGTFEVSNRNIKNMNKLNESKKQQVLNLHNALMNQLSPLQEYTQRSLEESTKLLENKGTIADGLNSIFKNRKPSSKL